MVRRPENTAAQMWDGKIDEQQRAAEGRRGSSEQDRAEHRQAARDGEINP